MAAAHIDGVENIEINNGVVRVSAVSEGDSIVWKMPLLVFRMGVKLAEDILAKHDAAGQVVPFKKGQQRAH